MTAKAASTSKKSAAKQADEKATKAALENPEAPQRSTPPDRPEAKPGEEPQRTPDKEEPVEDHKSFHAVLHVELVDANENTVHDVRTLVAQLGGEVTHENGAKVSVKPPAGSERNPDAMRTKLIHGLQSSPLILKVE